MSKRHAKTSPSSSMSVPSRRDVLKTGAAGALALGLGPFAFAKNLRQKDKIRFGVIGVGGKGWSGREAALPFGIVVALCDADFSQVDKGSAEHPDAARFQDYRYMIERMQGKVDAVIVSTPDHNHAAASLLAMEAGMHVYCEKPLTRTIGEARRLTEMARKTGLASQMGNQGTALDDLRKTAAAIRSGAFGAAKEVHCWTDRSGGWWPQGVARPMPEVKPENVDWNVWLGPAPVRHFAKGYHPFSWRGWWDFGSGALGDMGCHCMNLPFMALDLIDPVAISAETSGHNQDSYPSWSHVKYEFGQRGSRPPLTVHWYDGGKRPPQDLVPGRPFGGNGAVIVMERATLYSDTEYGGNYQVVGGQMPEVEYEKSPGHMAEFARAILGGPQARSNIATYSGPLTEFVLLGNLAVWASGRRLEWDAASLKVKGTSEFDDLIRPTYRSGWSY